MLQSGDAFYLRAFRHLGTTRQLGMAQGPIPYDRVVEYGRSAGLDRVMIAVLVEVIARMDGEYLRWCAEEAEKRAQAMRGNVGNVTVTKGK